MDGYLSDDLAGLPDLLSAVRDYAAEVLAGLGERPAAAQPKPASEEPLPGRGLGARGALTTFAERWAPEFSASAGPRYLGFVTGGATPAAVAGDWLTSVFDQNAASAGDSSADGMERQAISWLRELFGLTARHQGTFVSGSTVSNYVGLAVARQWLGKQLGVDVSRSGLTGLGPVLVLSGTPHASISKALSMAGIGRDSLRLVPVQSGREAVDVSALKAALRELDGRPAVVVANAGTVNTADFDDLGAIARLRERYPFWLHVDGAFGAFAALSGEHAGLLDGLDEADSVCVDLHKWLNVPYDSAVQFTRHRDLQLEVFHNAAAYLGTPGAADPDPMHLVPENSRRLRALPVWMTLAAYGRDGHREIVERDIACARDLGARIDGGRDLRLLAPVRLNVVCFTLAGDPSAERVAAYADAVAASGEAFVTTTVYAGIPALRAAFSNWRTVPADTARVYNVLAKLAAAA